MSSPSLAPPPVVDGRPTLARSTEDRFIAGVAGGIGQHLGIDTLLVRIAFVLLALSGVGLLVYLVAWISLPEETPGRDGATAQGPSARVAGLGLIALGVILLTQRAVPDLSILDLAPVLVIGLGILLAVRSGGRR